MESNKQNDVLQCSEFIWAFGPQLTQQIFYFFSNTMWAIEIHINNTISSPMQTCFELMESNKQTDVLQCSEFIWGFGIQIIKNNPMLFQIRFGGWRSRAIKSRDLIPPYLMPRNLKSRDLMPQVITATSYNGHLI